MAPVYVLLVSVCLANAPCRTEELGKYNMPTACLLEAQSVMNETLTKEELASKPTWKCNVRK